MDQNIPILKLDYASVYKKYAINFQLIDYVLNPHMIYEYYAHKQEKYLYLSGAHLC